MKRCFRTSVIAFVMMCVLIPTIFIPASADTFTTISDVPKDQYSQIIPLNGNFHFTCSLILSAPGYNMAFLNLYLFDGETQEQACNLLHFTHDSVNNLRTDLGDRTPDMRWEESDCTKVKPDSKWLHANQIYHISLRRWNERILLRITDENNNNCGTILYKAKADVAETLYLQFSPGAATLTQAKYSIGETLRFRETFLKNESWVTWICIIVVLFLLIINFVFGALDKKLFDGGFNIITGGLWGIGVLLSVCMVFPTGRGFLNNFISEFLGIGWFTIPEPNSFWYWLLLILAMGYTLILWLAVAFDSNMSAPGATVAMLLLGALHGFSLLIMVGILVYLVVALIGLALLIGIFGSGGNSNTSSDPPPTTEQKKVVKVWREDAYGNREYMKVGTSGEFYQDPDTGEWHRIKK